MIQHGIHPAGMKIVVSVDDPALISGVLEYNPAFIEIRLDRMEGDLLDHVRAIREMTAIPLIATLRSREEGGGFVGDADLFHDAPSLDLADAGQRLQRRLGGHLGFVEDLRNFAQNGGHLRKMAWTVL